MCVGAAHRADGVGGGEEDQDGGGVDLGQVQDLRSAGGTQDLLIDTYPKMAAYLKMAAIQMEKTKRLKEEY